MAAPETDFRHRLSASHLSARAIRQLLTDRLGSQLTQFIHHLHHNPQYTWEAATKILVVVSIVAAELVQDILSARHFIVAVRYFTLLPFLAVCGCGLTLLAARRWGDRTVSAILVFLYIYRGLGAVVLSHESFLHIIPLSSCLLGLILYRPFRTSVWVWHFPPAWKFPLVLWALLIACSWPIVLLRELDWVLDLTLFPPPLVNNATGLNSSVAAAWAVREGLVQGLAVLWADWLFATFSVSVAAPSPNLNHKPDSIPDSGPASQLDQQDRFRRYVLRPLGLSFCLTSLVGLYQAFIDMHFLNPAHWIDAGRVTGTMLEATRLAYSAPAGGLSLSPWR